MVFAAFAISTVLQNKQLHLYRVGRTDFHVLAPLKTKTVPADWDGDTSIRPIVACDWHSGNCHCRVIVCRLAGTRTEEELASVSTKFFRWSTGRYQLQTIGQPAGYHDGTTYRGRWSVICKAKDSRGRTVCVYSAIHSRGRDIALLGMESTIGPKEIELAYSVLYDSTWATDGERLAPQDHAAERRALVEIRAVEARADRLFNRDHEGSASWLLTPDWTGFRKNGRAQKKAEAVQADRFLLKGLERPHMETGVLSVVATRKGIRARSVTVIKAVLRDRAGKVHQFRFRGVDVDLWEKKHGTWLVYCTQEIQSDLAIDGHKAVRHHIGPSTGGSL